MLNNGILLNDQQFLKSKMSFNGNSKQCFFFETEGCQKTLQVYIRAGKSGGIWEHYSQKENLVSRKFFKSQPTRKKNHIYGDGFQNIS